MVRGWFADGSRRFADVLREFTSKFTTIYTDIHKIHPNIKINVPSFTQGLLWYTPVWPHMLRFTSPVFLRGLQTFRK